jgi:hypothetical protein
MKAHSICRWFADMYYNSASMPVVSQDACDYVTGMGEFDVRGEVGRYM